ncbi:MAG: aspartate-semialdehyde dehydrogenase [Planctomycetia bacterium]|nr:aspartate-semialdehyde dehydrogenase [Planctomycetia bacterium]
MIDTLAVVGATGAVGRIIVELLLARQFPARRIKLLASERSAGRPLEVAGARLDVEVLRPESFDGVAVAIGSTPDEVAAEFVPWAVERGTVVVDESGFFRMRPDVPLVIPEVNPEALAAHRGIISSPNCSTTQMVMVMKPLHDAARVRRVIVSTYQAVSGAGLAASREMERATAAWLSGEEEPRAIFPHAIAANLIPQIGSPRPGGSTSEELKMVHETRKILGDESIGVCATCVRVPVANCHSESMLIETERRLTADEVRRLLAAAPGVVVDDELESKRYPMPRSCTGRDEVFVGRIREDDSGPNGIALWCVSDNLRKGAATNAVQIAEHLATHPAALAGAGRTGGGRTVRA